ERAHRLPACADLRRHRRRRTVRPPPASAPRRREQGASIMRRLGTLLAIVCFAGTAGAAQKGELDPHMPYQGMKSNPMTYQVDFSAVVTPPYHAKVLKVWLPLPPSDAVQEVTGRELSTFPMKVTPKIGREPVHGNHFAYFEFDHPEGAQII